MEEKPNIKEPPVVTGEVSGNVNGRVLTPRTLLTVRHFTADGREVKEDYREVHNKVITNAGRDAIVDAFTGAFTLSDFKYHHCGSGTGDEAATQTELVTPVSESRVQGTQSQPTSDVFRSVGSITFIGPKTVREHGLFSASSGGTMLDRSTFTGITVAPGEAIEFTFDLTFASGG